jgi:hypothetical protein
VHPGGVGQRKALEIGAEYSFQFERYVDFDAFDTNMHNVRLYGRWRFFPKTALEIDAKLSVRQWLEQNDFAGRTNSMPLRITAGINGFITKKLATTLKAGYAQGFYAAGPDVQTAIGQASLTWTPMSTIVLTGGYQRDFVDSLYGNFYTYDRFFLDTRFQLFGALSLQATAGFQLLEFSRFDPSSNGQQRGFIRYSNVLQRNEQAVDAKLSLSYDFARYIGLIVSYEFRTLLSDFEMFGEQLGDSAAGVPAQPVPRANQRGDGSFFDIDRGGYVRHFVLAGVSIRY